MKKPNQVPAKKRRASQKTPQQQPVEDLQAGLDWAREKLCALCGLAEGATDKEINAAIKKAVAK